MKLKIKDFSLRIDEKTLEKLHFIAKSEDRSVTGELLHLVRKRIADFETEHGIIHTSFDEENE